MSLVSRALGLIVVTVCAVAAWAFAQHATEVAFFQPSNPRPYIEMVACAVMGALAAGVVSAIPLVWLFRRRAWLAALGASRLPWFR